MGDEELSPADKLKIAANFIAHAPPGQSQRVKETVDTLLDGVPIPPELMRKLHTTQYLGVKMDDDGRVVLLTPFGELPDGSFVDPVGNRSLIIDHFAEKCTGFGALPPDVEAALGASAAARASVDKAMGEYAKNPLPGAAVTTYADASGTKLTCCMASLNASLSQYWAGSYRSSWTLDTSSGALEGSIKCLIHYFEDGNVQLDDGASFKASVDVSGDVGAALAKAVKAHEAPFMEKLEDIYLNLSKDLLGALRRRLPVTKQKFDWERAGTGGVAKLGKNLQEMAAK